jgi:hypothetical protein
MVPKDWQCKGWVNVGVAVLGCWVRHCRVFLAVEAVELSVLRRLQDFSEFIRERM